MKDDGDPQNIRGRYNIHVLIKGPGELKPLRNELRKIATTKNYILSILSLSIILNLFLIFCKSVPEYSYKLYSYKKKSVCLLILEAFLSFVTTSLHPVSKSIYL